MSDNVAVCVIIAIMVFGFGGCTAFYTKQHTEQVKVYIENGYQISKDNNFNWTKITNVERLEQ